MSYMITFNSFQMNYQSMLMQMTFKNRVHYLNKLNKRKTQHWPVKLCIAIASAKSIYQKIFAEHNYRYKYCEAIHLNLTNWKLPKQLDDHSSNVTLFLVRSHFEYAKFARLYLQLMDELPIDFPWLHNLLQQGYYAIRRFGRFWTGL